MELIRKIDQLTDFVDNARSTGKSIGFVPTMGALHEGHLQLVKRAVKENDIAIVSVFVNPTQFNDKNDLVKYPRTLEADAALLQTNGCAAVFSPIAEEFYSEDELNNRFDFDFGGLDQVMEGKSRPGHFNGVVQVVSKLFRLVKPNVAYFGEKDFQQLAIIRRMVKLMNFDIEIVGCPIVRQDNGLARSSRNSLLTEAQREIAANIYAVLKESTAFFDMTSVGEVHDAVIAAINRHEGLEVEYFDIVNADTLQTIKYWDDAENVVGCITVHCCGVRLIDNIKYK